jgi:transposase
MLDKNKLTFGGAFFMRKYTYEQRLKAVLDVAERYMSCRAVAKQLGCGKSIVHRWVQQYEQHGVEGLIQKHGTYTGEFKLHVVEYMQENHLSISQTAVLFGIPGDATVGKWVKVYYEEGPQALYRENRGQKNDMPTNKSKKEKMNKEKSNPESQEGLIAEIERLRMENAYLKKLNALVQERIARESGKK